MLRVECWVLGGCWWTHEDIDSWEVVLVVGFQWWWWQYDFFFLLLLEHWWWNGGKWWLLLLSLSFFETTKKKRMKVKGHFVFRTIEIRAYLKTAGKNRSKKEVWESSRSFCVPCEQAVGSEYATKGSEVRAKHQAILALCIWMNLYTTSSIALYQPSLFKQAYLPPLLLSMQVCMRKRLTRSWILRLSWVVTRQNQITSLIIGHWLKKRGVLFKHSKKEKKDSDHHHPHHHHVVPMLYINHSRTTATVPLSSIYICNT